MESAKQDSIKCIFYTEFNNTVGPVIPYQVPDGYICKDDFDALLGYIITKPELQMRIITINAFGQKILGCPVMIGDPEYPRNAFMFNLCFVFDVTAHACPYEIVVKKLAKYLTQMEMESSFLSNAESKVKLPALLEKILFRLNEEGQCSINIESPEMVLHLKASPCITEFPIIQDHDVPVLMVEQAELYAQHWDLTSQQILPHINSLNHITRIASEADVEINLVKASIQNLMHYRVVKIIPIFQYCNVFTCTPDLCRLNEDGELQDECIRYVATQGGFNVGIRYQSLAELLQSFRDVGHRPVSVPIDPLDAGDGILNTLSTNRAKWHTACWLKCSGQSLPKFRDVFVLYCGLTPGTTVRDLCARHNPHGLKIDERKLIQFGLLNGLIRRLNKYPVKLLHNGEYGRHRTLTQMFNGIHSYDEICCKTGMSYQEIDDKVENDPSTYIIWK